MSPFDDYHDTFDVSETPAFPDLDTLDRYLAGECTRAEREAVEQGWFALRPEAEQQLRTAVEQLSGVDDVPPAPEASWAAFRTKLEAPLSAQTVPSPQWRVARLLPSLTAIAAALVVGVLAGHTWWARQPAAVTPAAATPSTVGPVAVNAPNKRVPPKSRPAPATSRKSTVPVPPASTTVPVAAAPAASAVQTNPAATTAPTGPSIVVHEPAHLASATDIEAANAAREGSSALLAAYLRQTDVFLTSVRADVHAQRVDPEIGRWARNLLVTTELLRDTRAGHDPSTKALLTDMELVLVQLATYRSSQQSPMNLQLAQDVVDHYGVITRIRASLSDRSHRSPRIKK